MHAMRSPSPVGLAPDDETLPAWIPARPFAEPDDHWLVGIRTRLPTYPPNLTPATATGSERGVSSSSNVSVRPLAQAAADLCSSPPMFPTPAAPATIPPLTSGTGGLAVATLTHETGTASGAGTLEGLLLPIIAAAIAAALLCAAAVVLLWRRARQRRRRSEACSTCGRAAVAPIQVGSQPCPSPCRLAVGPMQGRDCNLCCIVIPSAHFGVSSPLQREHCLRRSSRLPTPGVP